MSTLRIELFGSPRLSGDAGPIAAFPTQRAMAIFAFLVIHRGRLYGRDQLAGTFWGERPDAEARKYLRTDLWRIRRTLQRAGAGAESCLTVRDHLVGFDAGSDYWLDVQEFETEVVAGETRAGRGEEEGYRRLERAIGLYRGELLEGVYEDWCVYEQERARAILLRALEAAMRYQARYGVVEAAIAHGARLLAHDPIRESIHREMMALHRRAGNRPAALLQYRQCREILWRELEVEPMEETERLHREMRAVVTAAPVAAEPVLAGLGEVGRAMEAARRAQAQLAMTIRLLEGAAEAPASSAGSSGSA